MEKSLLLVDDEDHVCKAIQRLCRKEGYQIHVASCAEGALLFLKNRPVSVILSDQRLPGISGVQFLSKIKQALPADLYGAFTTWRESLQRHLANESSKAQEFVTDYGRFTTSLLWI